MMFGSRFDRLSEKVAKCASRLRKRALTVATWVWISRFRNSFVSKALSALSISALVISNIPDALSLLGVTPWTIFSIYLGSIVFLTGYSLFIYYSPSEFKGQGEMVDHVSRMQVLNSEKFVNSRLELASAFIVRVSGEGNMEIPSGVLESLEETVEFFNGKTAQDRLAESSRLFQDDLAAREHDFPLKRIQVASLLMVGAFMIALPTMINVLVSLWAVFF